MAVFKVKSALQSHLQIKHSDKHAINVNQIPDVRTYLSYDQCETEPNAWLGSESNSPVISSSFQSDQERHSQNRPELAIYKSLNVITPPSNVRRCSDAEAFASDSNRAKTPKFTNNSIECEFDGTIHLNDTSHTDNDDIVAINVVQVNNDDDSFSPHSNEYAGGTEAAYNSETDDRQGENLDAFRHSGINSEQFELLRTRFIAYEHKITNEIDCELVGRDCGLSRHVVQVGLPCSLLFLFCGQNHGILGFF